MLAALVGGGITAGVLVITRGSESAAVAPSPTRAGAAGALAAAPAERLTTAEIFERSVPSIVAIHARSVQPVASVFDDSGGPEQGFSSGSGFVLDEDGHVVTSAQVVTGVTDVQVTFADLLTVPARVVGKDEQTDLALLQVDAADSELQPLPLGDSDTVQVGDRALAVGNPSGVEATAGSGVVAARGEQIETANGVMVSGLLRTDAVIVPGSAGGPLLGADGRVIGISSRVAGDEEGMGFAVPVNTARAVLAELQERHKLIRPYLGIRGQTVATPVEGVLIEDVYPGGPAEQVGLLPDDVIEAVDGRRVHSLEELLAEVERRRPGQEVELSVLRGGSRTVLRATIAERPATLPKG